MNRYKKYFLCFFSFMLFDFVMLHAMQLSHDQKARENVATSVAVPFAHGNQILTSFNPNASAMACVFLSPSIDQTQLRTTNDFIPINNAANNAVRAVATASVVDAISTVDRNVSIGGDTEITDFLNLDASDDISEFHDDVLLLSASGDVIEDNVDSNAVISLSSSSSSDSKASGGGSKLSSRKRKAESFDLDQFLSAGIGGEGQGQSARKRVRSSKFATSSSTEAAVAMAVASDSMVQYNPLLAAQAAAAAALVTASTTRANQKQNNDAAATKIKAQSESKIPKNKKDQGAQGGGGGVQPEQTAQKNSTSNAASMICEKCDKVFTERGNYYQHIHNKSHSGRMPYVCLQCGLAYVKLQKCKAHIIKNHALGNIVFIDNNTKNFVDVSNFSQLTSSSVGHPTLANASTTIATLYKCRFCNVMFAKIKTRTSHQNEKHRGEFEYSCKKCQNRFADQTGLTRHSKLHCFDPANDDSLPIPAMPLQVAVADQVVATDGAGNNG